MLGVEASGIGRIRESNLKYVEFGHIIVAELETVLCFIFKLLQIRIISQIPTQTLEC